MRIVFRGSDVGYTSFCDQGFFKAADEGLVASANVMLDGRSARSALRSLRDRPWMSVEWQKKLWYRPVLPLEEVPSLLDENGRFKWGHRHPELWNEIDYTEAYRELCAELEMCHDELGRYPDVAAGEIDGSVLGDAFKAACDRYEIPVNCMHSPFFPIQSCYEDESLTIRAINPGTDRTIEEQRERGLKLRYFDEYDPVQLILDTELKIGCDYLISIHPGFVDDIILRESTMTLHRVLEVSCAMDERVVDWVKSNGLIISNTTDILHGECVYQEHLRAMGSTLAAV